VVARGVPNDGSDGQADRPGWRAGAGAALLRPAPPQYSTVSGEWVEFTQEGRATLAMMAGMAGWRLTEAVDIEATALLPVVTFPLLGIAPLSKVLPPYAADVIFLFMGGFIIGLAIERWGLDRRLAFFTLRLVGARPGAIVGGFMAVTAFLSMWVSNTA
jgi:solute carrier family 13 (sodium-dependent dicarboxylate transporter), member 2/3/5